jgi:cbb3-type cytochrome oxidase subunit 1
LFFFEVPFCVLFAIGLAAPFFMVPPLTMKYSLHYNIDFHFWLYFFEIVVFQCAISNKLFHFHESGPA